MVNKRTIFFASLAIIILIAFLAILYSGNAKNAKYDDSIGGVGTKNKTPISTPSPTITSEPPTPAPTIKIVAPTPMPQPTMKEVPEISINGPDNAAKGDNFALEFQINPKSEQVVGLEINIDFDGKLIEAKNVDVLDPNIGIGTGSYIKGNIANGEIKNIAIAKEEGENIAGNFMIVEFKALFSGTAQITAQITAVNEEYVPAEIKVWKIIKIV